MHNGQRWFEWFRKSPVWLRGGIGLLTLIISFVILARQNISLFITIASSFLLLALLWGSLYVSFVKTPPLVEGGRGVYRYPNLRAWGLGLAILTSLVIVTALFYERSRSYILASLAESESAPTFRLVSVSITNDSIRPVLDVKVRNIGDEIVVLKKARIHLRDRKDFPFEGCHFGGYTIAGLEVTGEYNLDISNLDIGEAGEVDISQSVSPNNADRFTITLKTEVDFHWWYLNKINLELVYNEEDQSIISPPIIFISSVRESSKSAELLYGYGLSETDILKNYDYLLQKPFYYFGRNNISEEEIIVEVKKCYNDNLSRATGIFSNNSMILSDDARIEFEEWKKASSYNR